MFELSARDSIAVMVNGDMNFAQTPLAVLIKMYRENCRRFNHVPEAATDFLTYLANFGAESPQTVKEEYVDDAIAPYFERIKTRISDAFSFQLGSFQPEDPKNFMAEMTKLKDSITSEQILVLFNTLSKLKDADFSGAGKFKPTARDVKIFKGLISQHFPDADDNQIAKLHDVCNLVLIKAGTGPSNTGLIVAGFGEKDLFPTLVHYTVHGIVGNRLKYTTNEIVDIDRNGARAKVLPFAQKEMVERFLYGLDEGNRRNIITFCKNSVPEIRKRLLELLEMDDESKEGLTKAAEEAERGFLDGLTEQSFNDIRTRSQREIEDMVEFMPKPEMARMAEALVNLTSIKRRVSRGMETVGGPIDVAIISRSEGLVWVQRKHYFPSELNARFFDRKRLENSGRNGDNVVSGEAR